MMNGGDTIRVVSSFLDKDNLKKIGPRPPTLPGQEQVRLVSAEAVQESCVFSTSALTPRKSNLHGFRNTEEFYQCNMPNLSNGCKCGHYEVVMEDYSENDAPLGYEPEGSSSACGSPSFAESRTPPYLKWARHLRHLLNDSEGVKLFRSFLEAEGCPDSLNFWFACEGLKKNNSADQIQALTKIIYRKFIRTQNSIHVAPQTRQFIQERMDSKTDLGVDIGIFDDAQQELEHYISKSTYPNFLKSDIYLQYVQSMQNGAGEDVSSKNGDATASPSYSSTPSSRSSNYGGKGDTYELLPTVMEDSELSVSTTLTLTSSHLQATALMRSGYGDIRKPEVYPGVYLQQNARSQPVNPYHALYGTQIPGSAQDSELQSLSSDAHTDETLSLTDSGLNGRSGVVNRKHLKQQHRAIKQNASQNYDPLIQTVIPRTHRTLNQQEQLIPTTNPTKFADMLIEKLEKVKKGQENNAKMTESLGSMEPEVNRDKTAEFWYAIANSDIDNEQSILDKHVSRIWNDSPHHTPILTPGHISPLPTVPCPKSPERRRASAPPQLNPYANKSLYAYHRHRKERDLVSTLSNDSGAIPDFVDGDSGSDSYRVHKYSHHHSGKSKIGTMAPESGPSEFAGDLPQRRSKETSKRNPGKKCSVPSNSSEIDSGVSLANEPNQPSSINVKSKEKVRSWFLNEKYYPSHPGDSEKDSSSRHKRSSYSSLSTASPGASWQGRGKKQVPFASSRSDSLERSGHSLRTTSAVQPAQPMMGDPSMPLLPQPNTTTQLEEARRRLEDDAKAKLPKSKAGVKDRVPYLDLAKGNRLTLKNSFTSEAYDDGSYSRKSTKKCSSSNPSLVTTPGTPVTPDIEHTVVGYQFFGDDVPYRSKLSGKVITLKQFKTLIKKKENFRFFFKKANDEFGTGIVYEEVKDDSDVLPLWEGKIFAKLEAID